MRNLETLMANKLIGQLQQNRRNLNTAIQNKIDSKYEQIAEHDKLMTFFIEEGDTAKEDQQTDCIILLQEQINKLELQKQS